MRILVTGAGGMLGSAVCERLRRLHNVTALTHAELDVTDNEAVIKLVTRHPRPDIIVHCAAFTAVDIAEDEKRNDSLRSVNEESLVGLCKQCQKYQIKIIYPQTFLVLSDFEGIHEPNSSRYAPLGKYAESKLEAEKIIRKILSQEHRMIMRIGGLFGGGVYGDKNFVGLLLNKIIPSAKQDGVTNIEVGDRVWQPTWAKDVARVIDWAINNQWRSSYQYSSSNYVSFAVLASAIIEDLEISDITIKEVNSSRIATLAPRPQRIVMKSSQELIAAGLVHDYRSRLRVYLDEEWSSFLKLQK